MHVTCPRCGRDVDERFYGPCATCRDDLRAAFVNEARIVDVHTLEGTVARLWEGDGLSGGGVIPGFRCSVAALFPPVPETEPAEPDATAP